MGRFGYTRFQLCEKGGFEYTQLSHRFSGRMGFGDGTLLFLHYIILYLLGDDVEDWCIRFLLYIPTPPHHAPRVIQIHIPAMFYLISTFPLRTVAYFNVVGFFVGGGAINDEVFCVPLLESAVLASNATTSCATPAGESAISLMSRVVRESLRGAARD